MSDYKPGLVAEVTWDDASQNDKACGVSRVRTEQAMRTKDGMWSLVGAWNSCLTDTYVTDVHPLVVLDDSGASFARMVTQLREVAGYLNNRPDAPRFSMTLINLANQIEAQTRPPRPEVYEHLSSQEGHQLHRALCGKLWQPQGRDKVTVLGRCPECAAIAESGWTA